MSLPAEVSYYPGCSLEASAREFDGSLRAVAAALGLNLRELADWSCCGASAAHAASAELALGLAARNLLLAEGEGRSELVVPCASCFSRLKHAEHALLSLPPERRRFPYQGRVRLWDFLEFLAQEEMIERLKPLVVRPLADLGAVCYHGCLTQRPPQVTGAARPEDPRSMERLLEALGVGVRPWSYKTDCCGASLALTRPGVVERLVGRLSERAREAGAECLVASCQMCQANLDMRQPKNQALPVLYFTELIALALGLPVASWRKRHFVDPRPLLRAKGLL